MTARRKLREHQKRNGQYPGKHSSEKEAEPPSTNPGRVARCQTGLLPKVNVYRQKGCPEPKPKGWAKNSPHEKKSKMEGDVFWPDNVVDVRWTHSEECCSPNTNQDVANVEENQGIAITLSCFTRSVLHPIKTRLQPLAFRNIVASKYKLRKSKYQGTCGVKCSEIIMRLCMYAAQYSGTNVYLVPGLRG